MDAADDRQWRFSRDVFVNTIANLLAGAIIYLGGTLVGAWPRNRAGIIAAVAILAFVGGPILGFAAIYQARRRPQQRGLVLAALVLEAVGVAVLLSSSRTTVIESFTLPLALIMVMVGFVVSYWRPELSSWAAYGLALAAAFTPSLVVALTRDAAARQLLLVLAAMITLIYGAVLRQRAPVVIGSVVIVVVTVNEFVRLVLELSWWAALVAFAAAAAALVAVAVVMKGRRRL